MVPVHERIDVSEAEGKPLPDQREIKHGAIRIGALFPHRGAIWFNVPYGIQLGPLTRPTVL